MKQALMLFLTVATLALAGCTSPGGDDDFVVPDQDDQGRYVITLSGNQFHPDKAEVPVGATVVWILQDGSHNVVADDGSFTSGNAESVPKNQDELEILEHTFEETGTVDYHCVPHQALDMVGTIQVVESL